MTITARIGMIDTAIIIETMTMIGSRTDGESVGTAGSLIAITMRTITAQLLKFLTKETVDRSLTQVKTTKIVQLAGRAKVLAEKDQVKRCEHIKATIGTVLAIAVVAIVATKLCSLFMEVATTLPFSSLHPAVAGTEVGVHSHLEEHSGRLKAALGTTVAATHASIELRILYNCMYFFG
jgi:hypothetical protein